LQQKNFTILLVDDNFPNLKILGDTFRDSGFAILTASSVEAAQDQLKTHTDDIDLVLSDIQMPGLTGFDLVSWMKAEKGPIGAIPILLITSQLPETENRIKGLSLGAVDYLLRSLDPEELVIRATHAIESFTQIRGLRQTLEHTENLASTGRLFAASNHEIKNVAQIIRMGVNVLERELSPESGASETCQRAIGMLAQSSTLLTDITKLIGGLVSNSEAPSGSLELTGLIRNVATMVKPLLKKDVELACDVPEQVSVLGSSTFVKQILINLLLNARDAIEEVKSEFRGRIVINIAAKDGEVDVVVTDSGVGFPSEETRSDFQPFASTKQLRGGTGLGLWLSSHLAQKMGGRLTLSSHGLGKGARATLTLKRGK
jgi:signal transduction histidine kinase